MKNILVTREEKKSQHIKKSLLKSGFSSIFEPLFQISTLPVKISDSAKYKAAIITSSNACEAIITSCNHQIKIYAISEKSVKKLIDAGFKNIIYASQKNAASLLQKILQTHPKSEAILHFHGPKITVDFVTNLSTHGFKIKGFQAYDLKENQCFSAKLLKFSKLQNLDSVLIFSLNSAEIFAKLCHKHNLLEYFSKPQILCLSDEIAKKVKSLGFQKSSNFEPIPSLKKFMTEEKSPKMLADIALKKPSKKAQLFLLKTAVIFSLLAFGYLGFRYLVFQSAKKLESQKELQKFDNIESGIFDLSIPADDSENGSGVHDFSDMAVNDLREKGAEFVYQMLLKNQVQISVLTKKIENLDEEIVKYKNQQRISRMILLYIDLRNEIFSKKPFEKTIENFELVAINDGVLTNKIATLKESAKKFSSQSELKNEFSQIIPKLIIAKKIDKEGGFWAKIKAKISQLIVIRKLNGTNPEEIDSRIVKIEKLLTEEKYQEALTELLSFEQKYHEITSEFLDHLSAAIEIRSIDNEILNHLKSLS